MFIRMGCRYQLGSCFVESHHLRFREHPDTARRWAYVRARADVVHELLREAKLFDFFDMIVVSSEVGVRKPDPRIFETVLEELNVKPEEAVMIGNTISTDIFGGNAIGMRTVLFQLGQEYQRSEWETPDHTIHSLKELLELV